VADFSVSEKRFLRDIKNPEGSYFQRLDDARRGIRNKAKRQRKRWKKKGS